MGVFEEVFAARSKTEEVTQPAEGVFQEVFVARGRWRNKSTSVVTAERPQSQDSTDVSESDIVAPALPEDTPMSDSKTAAPAVGDVSHLIVKNGFYEEAIDYDSLKDFLFERKIQSCPVRSLNLDGFSSIRSKDTEVASAVKDETLNTASNYGDVDMASLHTQQQVFRTGSSFGDQDTPLRGMPEEGFKTGSDFGDTGVPLRLSEGAQSVQAQAPHHLSQPLSHAPSNSTEDVLTSLRMRGSAIHETLLKIQGADLRGSTVELQSAAIVQPHSHVSPAVPWYESACGGCVLPPPPPPPAMAPVSAPVLRLADAVAPPELGTAALPSIGSLLHHKRECKPCTFFHTRGCENKEDCDYCHLCGPGEKKKRLRAQRAARRDAKAAALENARAILAAYSAAEECEDCDMIIE